MEPESLSDKYEAVKISLFTDLKDSEKKGGWWGTSMLGPVGSLLWTIDGLPSEENRKKYEQYSKDALAWMLELKIFSEIKTRAVFSGGKVFIEISLDGDTLNMEV
jgi:phage gp46-like protein